MYTFIRILIVVVPLYLFYTQPPTYRQYMTQRAKSEILNFAQTTVDFLVDKGLIIESFKKR